MSIRQNAQKKEADFSASSVCVARWAVLKSYPLNKGGYHHDGIAYPLIVSDEAVSFHVVIEITLVVVFVIELTVDNVEVVFVHLVYLLFFCICILTYYLSNKPD
jgi:hypothetical protein